MQRQAVSDSARGVITRLDSSCLLSADALSSGEIIARGELEIRYGIPLLGKPHLHIVPDLVVGDRGEMLTGDTAWNFIMERGHLFPRADVCGLGQDGADAMLFMRELDLALPCAVFAYRDLADTQPLARLDLLIATDTATFPKRLLDYLRRFDSLDAWRADG